MVSREAWVLGASGRTGSLIAAALHEAGVGLTLVGRDRGRLERLAARLDGAPRILAAGLDQALLELAAARPGVVVSTVGPFAATAARVARACPPGTHYVDVSNELSAATDILALDRQAAATDRVFVTGAGFGVLATEAVVLELCAGRPRPAAVRTDALAAVALQAGVVGPALAATIVEVVSVGGREVRDGRLVRAATGGHFAPITTPDGDLLGTGGGASAELIAAWRASDADAVVAASPAAPSNPAVRALLPVVTRLVNLPGAGGLATRAVARIPIRAQPMPRTSSWGHARVRWPDGQVRDGWLRSGEATQFTAAVAAGVTLRLLNGEVRPGAHTPGALFGPELAREAGATFVIDNSPATQDMKVLVVGAAGKTGRAVVEQAVKAGHEVTALVHSDNGYNVAGVAVRVGDATDAETVYAAVTGQDAVIDTVAGKTPYKRTKLETSVATAIVAAMQRHDVRRLVVTSMIGEGDSAANTPLYVKILLATFLRGAAPDKAGMESAVRGSDLDWVITRPPILTDKPATGDVRVVSTDSREKAHSITRADLAAFLVAALNSDEHLRKAVTIANR